ncbi:coiled-coil domain-containing glutamate-rich protein 1 [Austrofundulus limnaeus]|uniref:Coiled-coil domain-containing glutamate-rich protein 1 n=1 Tax=Austrofundulus limnaeus TaxID=52670 RepID=A0A2I4BSU2_AUSLI|nr:PREDICTED: coiled-coil domain-containing glutamate-rich protein 1-like [Austrofundulus limnaeus]
MLSEIMCRRIFQQHRQQEEVGLRRKSCSGRLQGRRTGGGGGPRGRNPFQRHHHHHHHQRPLMKGLSLRPVNVKGFRARGMQAPKNTNQFLMHEKYQMQHLRSDSVGSDGSCSSDSDDLELTDMDSYLGVLENARGALLDSPTHDSPEPPEELLVLHRVSPRPHRDCPFLQEDSMQYFPSEDDLLQSQNFMQRDFVEFCDFLSN